MGREKLTQKRVALIRHSTRSILRTADDVIRFRAEVEQGSTLGHPDISVVKSIGKVGAWIQVWQQATGDPIEDVVWLPASRRALYNCIRELEMKAAS